MITIENQGQRIVTTNYWDSEHAGRGYFYLSWNAGAGRILVPDVQKPVLREMKTASEVILSRGPWTDQGGREGIELLWEDGTDNPFVITLATDQCDRLIPETDQGGGFVIAAWTRTGLKHRWPGRYRVVDGLPCLQPWSVQ